MSWFGMIEIRALGVVGVRGNESAPVLAAERRPRVGVEGWGLGVGNWAWGMGVGLGE